MRVELGSIQSVSVGSGAGFRGLGAWCKIGHPVRGHTERFWQVKNCAGNVLCQSGIVLGLDFAWEYRDRLAMP